MPRDALAEIASLEKQPKGQCRAAEVINEVPKDLRSGLAAAMAPDSGLTSEAITRWLRTEGIEISSRTVSRHRRSECACP